MAEGAPLLREYTLIRYRGFESLPLRHFYESPFFFVIFPSYIIFILDLYIHGPATYLSRRPLIIFCYPFVVLTYFFSIALKVLLPDYLLILGYFAVVFIGLSIDCALQCASKVIIYNLNSIFLEVA